MTGRPTPRELRSMSDPRNQAEQLVADLPTLCTVAETALVLRVSERTVHRLLATRRLQKYQLSDGGSARVLIPRASIVDLLALSLR